MDGKLIDPVGDPCNIHQITGKDKKRHSKQREGINAADHPMQDSKILHRAIDQHIE